MDIDDLPEIKELQSRRENVIPFKRKEILVTKLEGVVEEDVCMNRGIRM